VPLINHFLIYQQVFFKQPFDEITKAYFLFELQFSFETQLMPAPPKHLPKFAKNMKKLHIHMVSLSQD